MRRRSRALLLALCLAGCGALGQPAAAQDAPFAERDLVVGVAERAPFAMEGTDGSWQGIAVDLWRMVAEDLGLAYTIVPLAREAMPAALAADEVDIALPIDATAADVGSLDYLMPHYTATLAVGTPQTALFWGVVRSLASLELLRIVLTLSALLLVVGGIIWAIERRRNAQQFHARLLPGLGDGFWWAGVTLTTIGYGDKAPVTFFGRAVAMLWMLMGLAVSAALTASVVSATDIERARTVDVPGDLVGKVVAVPAGGSAGPYLDARGVTIVEFATLDEAVAAVTSGEADAAAGGAPELRAAQLRADADLTLSTTPQDPQYVTIGVRPEVDPALRQALDRSVLERITSDAWWTLVARYLPSEG